MIVVLLAFSSALFYGVRAIFIKKGLKDSEPLAAALVNLIISSITQSLFLLISLPSIFSTEHTLYFFLAGVFICLSSVLGPIAIHRLGVSLSSPIQGSYPLFADIGIVILRELFSPFIFFGIGLVVMGIVSLSYKETGGVKGWKKIDGFSEKISDFPKEAQDYLEFIEKEVKIPIALVSIGPRRKETIEV